MIKIICVCGARPNFMKIAPIMKAFKESGKFQALLIHTGQHYDHKMSHLFFEELNIPKPDINLEVGSGSHAVQTAEVMKRFEPVVLDFKPDYVLVVGDVNSTIACGLVAVKLGVKLIHVEAGLRSFDRTMPEEINRILTDSISDLLFVTEQAGIDNLKNEGVNSGKVHLVGNVMIDTLLVNPRSSAEELAKYSFPSKNMEYMASGTPILTTPLPGMPKEYYPFVYIFDDETVDGFEKTLRMLLSKPKDQLHEFGRRAKEFVLTHKNNRMQADRILSFFSNISRLGDIR